MTLHRFRYPVHTAYRPAACKLTRLAADGTVGKDPLAVHITIKKVYMSNKKLSDHYPRQTAQTHAIASAATLVHCQQIFSWLARLHTQQDRQLACHGALRAVGGQA